MKGRLDRLLKALDRLDDRTVGKIGLLPGSGLDRWLDRRPAVSATLYAAICALGQLIGDGPLSRRLLFALAIGSVSFVLWYAIARARMSGRVPAWGSPGDTR